MNSEQNKKLKMVIKLIEDGLMELPKTTVDFEKAVRSIATTEESDSKGKPYFGSDYLNKDALLKKSKLMVLGRLKKGEWGYLSTIKDGFKRVYYFNDAVKTGVFGSNSSNEVFSLIIESMLDDGLVEVNGKKIKLK